MKPTVSDKEAEPASSPSHSERVVVSSVAKSWSAAYARAFTSELNSVDLPAFV